MELRHIRYLIAVAETGSLTEAAEKRLHTSQPSLSRQIRDLEDQVGVELLTRSARGVVLTDAGKAFIDHARLALSQVDAAVEAARRAALPSKRRFALGFLTGLEMKWLPRAMQLLHQDMSTVDVTVSSDYSPDLADAVARGRLDLAFMRAEPDYDLEYRIIGQEELVMLMPSDHKLSKRKVVEPKDMIGEPYVAMANKAKVLRAVIDDYLARSGVAIEPTQGVDVGARRDIYRFVKAAATLNQMAVLWVTTEFGELAEVCDRVIVLTQGRHTETLAGEELSEEAISAAALRQTREVS